MMSPIILFALNTQLHEILEVLVNLSISLLEIMGTVIIIESAVRTLYKMMTKQKNAKLFLMEGLSMGLSFKLGGEILRTVIVRDFKEVALVGCIIILRAGLNILLHWEISNEEKHEQHIEEAK